MLALCGRLGKEPVRDAFPSGVQGLVENPWWGCGGGGEAVVFHRLRRPPPEFKPQPWSSYFVLLGLSLDLENRRGEGHVSGGDWTLRSNHRGLCGSDRGSFQGSCPLPMMMFLPAVVGHETHSKAMWFPVGPAFRELKGKRGGV